MRKFWAIILFTAAALVWAADRQSVDPTNYALGARSIGLGGAVVAAGDDVNALRANPAILASNQKLQFGLSSYEFLNTYKFLDIVSIVPTPLGFFGVSYFSYGVNDIPETDATIEGEELRIYRTGQRYSYAENILGLTYAQQGPREFSFLKNIGYGGTFKLAYSTLAGETLSGWGLDAGIRFDLSLPALPFIGELGDLALGLGIQNLMAPAFAEAPSEEGGEVGTSSGYQMNLRLGAAKPFELFGQRFITAGDFDNNGLHFGLEYIADQSLSLRAGLDDFYPTYGLGYRVFSITGFDGNPYTLSLDYAFRTFPLPFDNVHYISITLRGVSKTKTPEIISSFESENLTANLTAVNGTAEPNADITVYVNERLRKTVKADAGGIWNADNIYLDDGQNSVYAVAKYEQFVESEPSNVVTLYTDQIKPMISTTIARSGDAITIRVSVNKEVETVLTRLPDGSQITLLEDESGDWLGSWNIAPEYYNSAITLRTVAVDGFGNRSDVAEDVYSARFVTAPRDRTITPRSSINVRGVAKEGTVRVAVGEQSVTPDADGRFNFPIELAQEGKNVVEIVMIDEAGQTVSTAVRVLKIQEADDLGGFSWARNQVASLLSLGVMSNDPEAPTYFRPEDFMTRAEFAKALVLLKGLELLPDPVNIAPDVLSTDENAPYIKAALDAGYLELQAGGFIPGAFITRKDAVSAIVLMENLSGGNLAQQIFEDVPPYLPYAPQVAAALEAGIISPQEKFYPDRELTRVEAAAMLAAVQTAQRRINELYDWKSGYGEQFMETPLSALPVYEQRVLADLYVNGRLISLDETAEENLRILSPLDRSIVGRQLIEVKGLVKGADHVLLNGVTVPAQKGVFLARVNLREGRNIIRVQSGAEPAEPTEDAQPEIRTARVLYVKAFSDKPDTLDNLQYNAASAYARFSRFDGGQPITRGEAQLILNGLKGASGGNTISAEPLSLAAAREMLNEWDGKEADDTTVAADIPDTAALTREQFITMLANTDFYKNLLEQYRNFDEYESAEDVAAPDNVQDRSGLIIQAEELNNAAAKKKITADDYQSFLARYDRLSAARPITRSGDSIAVDGRTRLLVAYPENNFRVKQNALTLSGFSGGVEEVRVNGRAVRAGSDSSFTQVVTLEAGKNNIVVDNGAQTVRLRGLRLLTYQDIQSVPERGLIEYLATLGYFKEGQDFYPNQELTREEVAALLVRMIGATPQQVAQPVFSDVAANRWSAPSIKLLVDRGIIKEANNNFRPEAKITQQEASAWYRALSTGGINAAAPQNLLSRREFARWLFADSRVRNEIDILNN
ncbi:hypothetical protein NO1_0108 [Candidatus Termititenax aidoneus]|uniref:SLH domain-containing protein n=1 Tax=Termititenax aidoneus TaxID=2218524 RepID=A0A388T7G0_TERA1|nr:hypothetical protein NO1_0108 [Candidatus Termititenax aidoneus]